MFFSWNWVKFEARLCSSAIYMLIVSSGAENKLRIVYETAVDRTPGQPACIKRFPAALFAWQVRRAVLQA